MQKLAKITRGKLNPTTEQIAYLAGVVDSITKARKTALMAKTQRIASPRYVLRITVTNTSTDLMQWLYENFGGTLRGKPRAKQVHKATYDWIYDNGKAIYILELIRPYLVVKKRQAELGIEFIEKWEYPKGGQGSKVPDHEIQRRERCWLAMKFLNQVGYTAATTECESSHDGHGMKRQSELMRKYERGIRRVSPASNGQ
jgi:hypothetical protein